MKTILLSLIGLFMTIPVFAQQAQVSGMIKGENTGQVMPYVIVALKDSTANMVATVITDAKGMFKLEKLPAGDLNITYSFMGFQSKTESIHLSAGGILKLETVLLTPDQKLLNEVSVTAQRASISLKLDKKVFEVGRDVLSQSGAVTDLLNIVPSVSVSPGGAISLRGNSNVLVLIDGRPTGLTQGNALEQVPADQVERVEVITKPSSRYDAAGSAGIINIILKKNKKAGFNGQLRIAGGVPNETRISPSLNYKSNKLNLFATYGLRLSDYVGLYTMQ
ncbi:MAG: TonB-dependent receptor, partial [Chitinophagaceae bacterium]